MYEQVEEGVDDDRRHFSHYFETEIHNNLNRGGKAMEEYLCSREIDRIKIPVDPKESGEGLWMQTNMVKQDIEKGIISNWGNLFLNTMDIQSFKEQR